MKVSIIIPAYNVSSFIGKTLQSCIEQTYKDWEAIIVNDGSTDNTESIINEYIQKDNRIRLINQMNQGQAKARQTALENATGDYVYFLDGDDYLHKEVLEKSIKKLHELKVDILIHDSISFWENGDNKQGKHQVHETAQGLENIQAVLKTKLVSVLWGKLYKAELFNEISHPVEQLKMGEDTLLFLEVLISKNPVIGYLSEPLYFYRQRETSTTKQGKILGDFMVDYAEKVEQKLDKFKIKEQVIVEWSKFNLDILHRILLDNSENTEKAKTFTKKVIRVNYPKAKHLLSWKRKIIMLVLQIDYTLAKKIIQISKN